MAGETVTSREMLRRLIAFDTTSRNSNLELIHYVRDYLKSHGVESKLVPSEDGAKANLYASIGPNVPGGVVLSGHTDVVPVDGQPWDTDPWVVTEKDGKLYGRGTSDMKAFSAIGLSMVPRFKRANLKVPIHFALSYDEEVGCIGAHSLAERLMGDVPRPRLIVVGEPTMMSAVHAHKGTRRYHTHFRGVEAHSSMTHLGVSANHFACEFVVFLLRLQDELESRAVADSEFMPPYGTITVGTIHGGTAANILARDCVVHWEYRALPGDDDQEVITRAQAYVAETLLPAMKRKHPDAAIEFEIGPGTPPFPPEGNDEAVKLVQSWSGSNVVTSVSYGTEAGIFKNAGGVPTVVCGPGDIAQAHQPNEFILVSQIKACEAFMDRIVEWASSGR
ncbi:MAG: acetylornithine deacetylase [Alphaproteobacteria bacterium]|nr:acetylornithine deacetylase [Alphaproteobacteria bacterium]